MHIKAHTTCKNTKNLSIVQNNHPRPPRTSLFGRPVYSEGWLIRKDSLLGRLAYSEDRFIGNRPVLLGIDRKEGYHYSGR